MWRREGGRAVKEGGLCCVPEMALLLLPPPPPMMLPDKLDTAAHPGWGINKGSRGGGEGWVGNRNQEGARKEAKIISSQ